MRDGEELTLKELSGGDYDDLPEYIEGADAEEAARLLRAAARELLEFRFPALALRYFWRLLTDPATSESMREDLKRIVGERIERLATIGLGQHDEAVVRQVAGLTFAGAEQTTTPRAQNSQGRETT